MSSNGNLTQEMRAILVQGRITAHQARKYYNERFVQSTTHPYVSTHDGERIDFFFEHTLKHFNFPNESTFSESVLKDGMTVKSFTKIFYDCFLRFNATFDMIGENTDVRHYLKVLLEEMKDYIKTEKIKPIVEKYEEGDIKNKLDETPDNTAGRWLRKLLIYRDFAKTTEYIVEAYQHFDGQRNSPILPNESQL